MNTTRNKKGLALLMLLGILIPYLTGMIPAIEVTAKTAPVTVMENIVDAEEVKADVSYEVSENEIQWEISYEKKASENPRRLKVQIDVAGNGLGSVRNLNYDGEEDSDGWHVLGNTYSSETEEGVITFATDLINYEVGEQKVQVTFQVDERIIEEVVVPAVMIAQLVDEESTEVEPAAETFETNETENFDILSDEVAGPHEIVLDEATLNVVAPGEVEEAPVVEEVPVGEVEAPVAEGSEEENLVEEVQEEIVVGPVRRQTYNGEPTGFTYANLPPAYTDYTGDSSEVEGIKPTFDWAPKENKNVSNHIGINDNRSKSPTGIESPWSEANRSDDDFINYFNEQHGEDTENPEFGIKKWAEETDTQGLFDVHLEVRGNQINESQAQLVDILLVADRSSSMVMDKSTRWANLKIGVNNFISTIESNELTESIHLGYTSFGTRSDALNNTVPISKINDAKKTSITEKLDASPPTGGRDEDYEYTNTHEGLLIAQEMLKARIEENKTNGREDAKIVMVLLTDGVPTRHLQITSVSTADTTTYPDGLRVEGYNNATLKGSSGRAGLRTDTGNTAAYRYNAANTAGGNSRIDNNFIAPVSVAQDIKVRGVENRVIGIQLVGETSQTNYPTYDMDAIEDRMKAIASKNPENESLYYYTNVTAAAGIVKELGKIAYEFTSTVASGSIVDPLGEQFNYDNVNFVNIEDTSTGETLASLPTAAINNGQLSVSNINLGKDQSVRITYQVRINTEDTNFVPEKWYQINGPTTFQPTPEGSIVDFGVPSAKAPGVKLDIHKKWIPDDGGIESIIVDISRGTNINNQRGIGSTTITRNDLVDTDSWRKQFSYVGENPTRIYFAKFNNAGRNFVYNIAEEGVEGYETELTPSTPDGTNKWVITNIQQFAPLDLKVNKASSINEETLLTGAEFSISGTFSNGSTTPVTLIDNRDGTYSLPDGIRLQKNNTYTLTEVTPPIGHSLGEKTTWTIVVSADGNTVTIDDAGASIAENIISYTIDNHFDPVPVQIKKINALTNEALAGAEFTLYKQTAGEWETNGISTMSATGTGLATFTNLNPGTHKIVETQGPDGFDTVPTEYLFTIDSYGVIESTNGEEVEGVFTFTHGNELKDFDLTITKFDDLDQELLGSEFTLSSELEGFIDMTPTADGANFTFTGLRPGSYTLTETDSPDGYFDLENPIEITINNDGSVTVDGDSEIAKVLFGTGEDINTISFNVNNKPLNPLPSTGGSGIYQFLLLGALVLTGTFGIVIFEKNRSRKGAY